MKSWLRERLDDIVAIVECGWMDRDTETFILKYRATEMLSVICVTQSLDLYFQSKDE